MRVSLKALALFTAAICVSLYLIASASLAAQWIAPTLILVGIFVSICVAAGGTPAARSFATAFLAVSLALCLTDWSKEPLSQWRSDFEEYTFKPLQSHIHSREGLPLYRRSFTGEDRIVRRTGNRKIEYLTLSQAEDAGIDIEAVPRSPTTDEFRGVFYSVLLFWLGTLAGFIALVIHRRAHSTVRDVKPEGAD